MSRARMIGGLSALVIAAGLAAGCGAASNDEGRVAAQVSPAGQLNQNATPSTSTTTSTTTATDGATTKALGAYPPADPKSPTMNGYDEFSKARAGQIFVEPGSLQAAKAAAEKASAASTASPTDTAAPTGLAAPGTAAPIAPAGSTAPTAPTAPTGTTPAVPVTGSKPAQATANLKVDGAPVIAKPGVQVPSTNPLFTVKTVQKDKVVMELITGSFPGGSKTVDIAAGASVTLSNPSTKATIVIEVVSITPAA